MDKLNQWLTFFTNFAVLAGIALLAYEIRQNTDALQSQTRSTIFSGAQEELWKNMEYPEITLNMGSRSNELSNHEKVRLDAWLTAAMRAREFAWLEFKNGNISKGEWEADQEVIQVILGSDRTRWWWREIASPTFHQGFVVQVNQIIDNQPNHSFVEKVLSIE